MIHLALLSSKKMLISLGKPLSFKSFSEGANIGEFTTILSHFLQVVQAKKGICFDIQLMPVQQRQ